MVNQRKFYPLVDNKFLTKRLAIQNGIKVPQLYGVINYHHQIPDVLKIAGVKQQSVVKPSMGCVGEGIQIPFWDEILSVVTRAYDMTKLGYIGVDIVIDRGKGPMVLAFNVRPGLSIQIANQAGLISRLGAGDHEDRESLSFEERIQLGQEIAYELHQEN